MASLDTNCLLRWLLGDIPEQAEIVAGLLDSPETFHAADAAIIELIFVLEKIKKIDRELIQKAVSAIMARANIKCGREIFEETMPLYTKHARLSITDCYLSVMAKKAGALPLLTFDRKLANQLGGKLLGGDAQ
ncbi:MAG: PIN domain-containing protein [Spirochaetaceae bacterium]|jgi:predicted nucleic-acid-binding protein|nr:PIN domain-containing protein [Spirochaetaceae bacterium]